MASGSREWPSRPDHLPIEHRSGHFSGPLLSEAQSAILPALPPPLPQPRRRFGLRPRLALWLVACGLLPALVLGWISVQRQRHLGQVQLAGWAVTLRELLPAAAAPGCQAVADAAAPHLRQIERRTGYHVGLYSGDRLLLGTSAQLPAQLPPELFMRALESAEPVLAALPAPRPGLLAALTRAPQGAGFGCRRLLLFLGTPDPGDAELRRLLVGLALLLPVLLGLSLLWPSRLSGQLSRLHDRVETLARLHDPNGPAVFEDLPRWPVDEPLLRQGDEIGDLSRAFAQMTDAMREGQARLAARVRELTTLHSIGRAISSVLDLQEALNKIVSEVVAVFSARRGALVLVGPDARYHLGAGVRIEPAAAGAVAALGEALIRRGGRMRIDDLSKDPELAAAARHGGLSGSLMAVPLDQQGRTLGILLITRSRGRQRFNDGDLQLLATVADQASTAISNARLYNEVQRSSEDLELRVKERTYDLVMANQELARALDNLHQAQAQLVLSERLAGLGQLVAGVAHEINSPAGAIKGAVDALGDNVVRMGERMEQLAQLPLPPASRHAFLEMCDKVAPALHAGLLPAPAALRRRSRDHAAALAVLREAGASGSTPAPPSLPTLSDEAALLDAGRKLAELGVEDPQVTAILIEASRSLRDGGPAAPRPIEGLGVLVGYLEQRSYLYRNAHAIRTAIGQITRIVGALKSYSHLDQAHREPTNVHEGLETTLVILHSELKYGILLTRKYGTVPAIHAYVDELNQVWTNLLHNAVQALQGQADTGRPREIVIETGYDAVPQRELTEGEGVVRLLPTGEWPALGSGEVWVAIEDNGPGIPKDVLPRIFEPFFTTKPKGEGTGIGLGIVRQIVNKHHGRIEVRSEPGRTRFTVWLPVGEPASASSGGRAAKDKDAAAGASA